MRGGIFVNAFRKGHKKEKPFYEMVHRRARGYVRRKGE